MWLHSKISLVGKESKVGSIKNYQTLRFVSPAGTVERSK